MATVPSARWTTLFKASRALAGVVGIIRHDLDFAVEHLVSLLSRDAHHFDRAFRLCIIEVISIGSVQKSSRSTTNCTSPGIWPLGDYGDSWGIAVTGGITVAVHLISQPIKCTVTEFKILRLR